MKINNSNGATTTLKLNLNIKLLLFKYKNVTVWHLVECQTHTHIVHLISTI